MQQDEWDHCDSTGVEVQDKAMFHAKVIRYPTYMEGSKVLKGLKINRGIMWFRKSKGNHQSFI